MLSDATFMDIAYLVGGAGTCARLQVGAVIVRDRRIISTGYNGAPSGLPHCEHGLVSTMESAYGDGACTVAVHAEANAIAYAAKWGVPTNLASLYVTNSPCQKCAELIINSGIKEVIYDQAYRLTDGLDLLAKAHIHTLQVNRSFVREVPLTWGDGPGVHTGKHTDPAFDEGWQALADDHRRGGTGV